MYVCVLASTILWSVFKLWGGEFTTSERYPSGAYALLLIVTYLFTWPASPYLPASWFPSGGGRSPAHTPPPPTFLRTWSYAYLGITCLHPIILMPPTTTLLLNVHAPPSDPPSLLSWLPYSCRRRTLVAVKIASTVTLICSSATLYIHHITRSIPPPSYPVSRAHTLKIGRVDTHSAIVAFHLSTYVLRFCVPDPCSIYSAGTFCQDLSLRRVDFYLWPVSKNSQNLCVYQVFI